MTQRQQAELALQHQQYWLDTLVNAVPDWIGVKDERGRWIIANHYAIELFGLENIDYRGKTDRELAQVARHCSEILKLSGESDETAWQAKTLTHYTETITRPNGHRNIFDIRKIPLFNPDGTPKGLVVVGHDITERAIAQEKLRQSERKSRDKVHKLETTLSELKQAQAQLIQSEKMSSLGQLVGGVAHEINNPINFIYANISHAKDYIEDLMGLVQLYQNHYPQPKVEIETEIEEIELEFLREDLPKLLSSMEAGTDRIREIVTSLRTFCRSEEAEIKAIDLHESIDSTLFILQSRLKAQSDRPDIQIVRDYGEVSEVECFPAQINQVFLNLLSNAVDAIDLENWSKRSQSPTICVRTKAISGDRVRISIIDNGSGIDEPTQAQLFDPFFTTKPVGKGTGLGLTTSHQIVVEQHRGDLRYVSTSGEGTEFIVEVPLKQPHSDPKLGLDRSNCQDTQPSEAAYEPDSTA